ncbi:MAG: hypothetical protein ACREYE_18355 [Gammaproteobacteria bacterium]
MGALRPQPRKDIGKSRRLSEALRQALQIQYQAHPSWSYKLHYDNLRALRAEDEILPTYGHGQALYESQGWLKQPRARTRLTFGVVAAEQEVPSKGV